jgi:oxalate decarboxylase
MSQSDVSQPSDIPHPIRGKDGFVDLGPRNVLLYKQNPDILVPPATDHGTLPNLKFSFSMAHNRLQDGGWARQVTQRELPAATEIAGVNMCLKPGGIRELHWHKQAEWAYMLWGRARISGVDQNGQNFLDDVGPGDMWNFPAGIPHSIQGLEEGCEFLLIFCTKPNYYYSNIRPPRRAYEIEGNDAKVAVIPDGLAVIVR